MSNMISDLESPDEMPYCIWHPETASEETYRELARRYPKMAYHVGRACAVAGYTNLYKELKILSDVHIAEEARECGNLAIYDIIMSQSARYSIMDDYTLSIDFEPLNPTHRRALPLNGDTAVRWMLDVKQKLVDATCSYFERDGEMVTADLFDDKGYDDLTFNITEDMNIDEHESDGTASRLLPNRTEVQLLYEPLPAELPTVQKDLLIVMAAYYGDVDRYARLRRPRIVHGEVGCCVRGIYHNTLFAVWWSKQPVKKPTSIEAAINARFIMNNVLFRAPSKPQHTPYLIWWPTKAEPSTYRGLAKLQPDMLPQIMHACIYAGYKDLFNELLPAVTPDGVLLREAERHENTHYHQALEQRAKALNMAPRFSDPGETWRHHISSGFGRSQNTVFKYLDLTSIGNGSEVPYDGLQCEAAGVETMVCLPDAWKLAVDDERTNYDLDYEDWPVKVVETSAF